VFLSSQGTYLRRSDFNRRVWQPATRPAGVEGLRTHDLRHTTGTPATAAGGSLREVMNRLGHSTTAAAVRYQHVMARPGRRDRPRAGPADRRPVAVLWHGDGTRAARHIRRDTAGRVRDPAWAGVLVWSPRRNRTADPILTMAPAASGGRQGPWPLVADREAAAGRGCWEYPAHPRSFTVVPDP
jgi:Phage integrase family